MFTAGCKASGPPGPPLHPPWNPWNIQLSQGRGQGVSMTFNAASRLRSLEDRSAALGSRRCELPGMHSVPKSAVLPYASRVGGLSRRLLNIPFITHILSTSRYCRTHVLAPAKLPANKKHVEHKRQHHRLPSYRVLGVGGLARRGSLLFYCCYIVRLLNPFLLSCYYSIALSECSVSVAALMLSRCKHFKT